MHIQNTVGYSHYKYCKIFKAYTALPIDHSKKGCKKLISHIKIWNGPNQTYIVQIYTLNAQSGMEEA